MKAIRLFNIYGFTGMSYAGNVWDINGLSPCLNTMSGGNRQPLIIEEVTMIKTEPIYEHADGTCRTLKAQYQQTSRANLCRTGSFGATGAKEVDNMGNTIRIRKLTPTECYKLMGFTAEDCKKASEGGISNSQLYKQAGNSIVVNVLEEIFKSLGETYEEFSV